MGSRRITVRVPDADADALEALARARRQATGDAVSTSGIVREAIAAHLAAQGDSDTSNDKE